MHFGRERKDRTTRDHTFKACIRKSLHITIRMAHRTQKNDHLRWRDTLVVKCGKMRRDGTSALFAGIRDRSALAATPRFDDLDLNARARTKARISFLVHCTMRLKRKKAIPEEFRA